MASQSKGEEALERYEPTALKSVLRAWESDVQALIRNAFLEGFRQGYDAGFADGEHKQAMIELAGRDRFLASLKEEGSTK